ncbi:sigma 54-interacting transcriptional regulator [Candidatus Sumerlaeota bacterium]|nr:sigma 54-interacting transcriptional regulator [Candidatus Sumerlaeota bacterium]
MESKLPDLFILVVSGHDPGRKAHLDRPLLLGRDPSSRLVIDDERVSRHHAMIEFRDGEVKLRDLGSKNGTFVNGIEIKTECTLHPSDRIRIGKTLLALANDQHHDIHVDRDRSYADTQHDGMDTRREESHSPIPGTEVIRVHRKILRQATEIAERLSEALRGKHPLPDFMSVLRREFQSTAAGCFLPDGSADAAYIDGILPLQVDQIAPLIAARETAWHCELINALPETALSENLRSPLMVIPLRVSNETKWLIFLRRDDITPFDGNDLSLAEMLVECLRLAPLANLQRGAMKQQLPPHLGIIGSSDAMINLRAQLQSYAPTNATTLIRGESGTGKELCARAIAHLSPRRFANYVELNAACMTPDLLESELFGHEKGSFTGATQQRIGKLEAADKGTLFLDEIGELPLELQAKLLRVLEGQPFYRVGGNTLIHSDVRFICATNRHLEQMVLDGQFRQDLYHRINILTINIPPLREHIDDIPELMTHLLAKIQEGEDTPREFRISPRVYRRMLAHNWPGNVRELHNILQRMIIHATDNTLDEHLIPDTVGASTDENEITHKAPRLQTLTEMLEREEIMRTMSIAKGQKSTAAKLLGISRPTLDKKLKTYGLGALVNKSQEPPAGS